MKKCTRKWFHFSRTISFEVALVFWKMWRIFKENCVEILFRSHVPLVVPFKKTGNVWLIISCWLKRTIFSIKKNALLLETDDPRAFFHDLFLSKSKSSRRHNQYFVYVPHYTWEKGKWKFYDLKIKIKTAEIVKRHFFILPSPQP